MPVWCDMFCPDAQWPEDDALDGAGSCRTFIAIYCNKYKRLNKKNAPCLDLTEAAPKSVAGDRLPVAGTSRKGKGKR